MERNKGVTVNGVGIGEREEKNNLQSSQNEAK